MRNILTRCGAAAGVWALAGALLLAIPSAAQADAHPENPSALPPTVTADALPTVQIDGVVWSQVIIGDIVYAGGNFGTARPAGAAPGTQTVTRNNLLAYNIKTGELITSFAPSFNAQVLSLAASPDGERLYVGGDFTSLNGAPAERMVALNPATGARIAGFDPQPSNTVYSIIARGDTVFFGGSFFRVGAAWREQVAAVRASDAALLSFRPVVTGGQVTSLTLSPDATKLAIGGYFDTVNGTGDQASGLAVVETATGEKLAYEASAYVSNGVGGDGAITSLASDQRTFYASGFTYGRQATLEGIVAIDWDDLGTRWLEDCHGDTYSVHVTNDLVYLAGHPHYCGNVGGFPQEVNWSYNRALAFGKEAVGTIDREIHGYTNFEGLPHPQLRNWFPALSTGNFTGQYQGPWSVTGNDEYIVYGGEFLRANYTNQQGLVRFSYSTKAPNLRGPEPQGNNFVPTLSSNKAGEVRVRWQAASDMDDSTLEYRVIRDGNNGNPIHTTSGRSNFWLRPGHSYTDTGLTPGSTHSYRIFAVDPTGREARSSTVSITVATSDQPVGNYEAVIKADQPTAYWPVRATDGNTVVDASNAEDLSLTGAASRVNGATIPGGSGSAITLGSGTAGNDVRAVRTNRFSTELWFRAGVTQTGRLIGFADAVTGTSRNYDRVTYLNSFGRLSFGVTERGTRRTITSSASYTDNKWHHVVATLGSDGMRLYVDGAQVASRASTTTALEMEGYWRLGVDRLSGWPSAPTSGFAGQVDEIAVYPRALSAARIADHYAAGQGQSVNLSPTAKFSSDTQALKLTVNGSESSDPDGNIASYAWDFGDGATGTGVSATHTYAAAGTYTVKLTVTDNKGATGTASKQVTVSPPNQTPTASFTANMENLDVSVDGRGSTDPEGGQLSYAWDFGDGENGTGATATHHYASAGSYQITLTVTDPQGASDSATRTVEATIPPGPLAADAFGRSDTGGWGTADVGGSWARTSSAASIFVSSGTGKLVAGSPGHGPGATLPTLAGAEVTGTVSVTLDKVANGGGSYLYFSPRYQDGGNQYQLKLRISSDGSGLLILDKMFQGNETFLDSVSLPSLEYQAGQKLWLKIQADGTSPTALGAKVWKDGTNEPPEWQVEATDSEAALQAAGGVRARIYVSGSASNTPVTAAFDDLIVEVP
ncbi:PKD domain-containing protein [Glutamicibacter endophyticus]|uniref:PKD domain-containing protein n=1 Tax=Glutamicibacter endophyticus TaxID=1522174 RepID=UPI003AEFDFC3